MVKGIVYSVVSLILSLGPMKADLKNFALTAAVILGAMAVAEFIGEHPWR